jgi:hypothetical protein
MKLFDDCIGDYEMRILFGRWLELSVFCLVL